MSQKSYDGSPVVYLIPTPIGNMDDITLRAINTLKEVEVVFSEDTRVTGLLLKHLGIKKKLISSHKFNEDGNRDKLLEYLSSGFSVGVVSDRGTPCISDPGYELALCAIENGYNVVGLPGPTAFVPALIVSGLDISKFTFIGFLNSKSSKRRKELEELKYHKESLIFYESPHRIKEMLEDVLKVLGNRRVSISREITKRYEEVFRENVIDIIPLMVDIKGEFVIIVEGSNEEEKCDNLTILEHIEFYKKLGNSDMDAIKLVAKERGVAKSVIYNEYHLKR